jgi:O-antigen ligase
MGECISFRKIRFICDLGFLWVHMVGRVTAASEQKQGPAVLASNSGAVAKSATIDHVLFWLFVAALAWCPFWFGSSTLASQAINAVLFPVLAIGYEASILLSGRRHPVGLRYLMVPALLFLAVVLWVLLQIATWTPGIMQNPIWDVAADALGHQLEGSISVNRDLTVQGLLRLMTAACVFWLSTQLCRNPIRAHRLLLATTVIVCAYAAYGLFAYVVTPGYVLWFRSPFSDGILTSTFINRNSFATFAGIGVVVIVGLLFRHFSEYVSDIRGPVRQTIISLIEAAEGMGLLLTGGAILIVAALLLTGSRGGIFSTIAGLFAFGALAISRRRSAGRIVAILILAATIVMCVVILGDRFIAGLAERGIYDQGRVAAYVITLRSIFDAPWLGYGYNTFPDVFPMFRDRSLSVLGHWEMAHHTYLELFQGLGLIFGSILVLSVSLLVLCCLKGATTRASNAGIPAVALSAAMLVGVHSLVDFSLQIQAVALLFMAILGAGVAQSESQKQQIHD